MKDIYKQKRDEFTKKHLKKYEGEVVDKISFDFNEELKGEVLFIKFKNGRYIRVRTPDGEGDLWVCG